MYFLVKQQHTSRWYEDRTLREQPEWPEHAAFMNALDAEGFVALGGPLHDGALLVVDAEGEGEIRSRLAEDPWAHSGLLDVAWVERWEILLGELPPRRTPAP